jgi:hypothetical protein
MDNMRVTESLCIKTRRILCSQHDESRIMDSPKKDDKDDMCLQRKVEALYCYDNTSSRSVPQKHTSLH